MTTPEPILAEVLTRLCPGARLDAAWPLAGGVSAEVWALAFTPPEGPPERVVVRTLRSHAWKPGSAEAAAREHTLLRALHAHGLPVARPRLLHPPHTTVMDLVEGTLALPPDPGPALGALLAQVHRTPLSDLPPLEPREDPRPGLRAWLPPTPALEAALDAWRPTPGPPRLLHGDFWPGNVLWRDGAVAALLDWEDAAVGDPLSDLACARAELCVAAGPEAAERLTAAWLERLDLDPRGLAVWDLYVSTAALDSMDQWGLAPAALEARRAATRALWARALAAVQAGG